MFWQSPSSPVSKSPLRNASPKGPVGSTRWVTLRPILLHWSMTQVPLVDIAVEQLEGQVLRAGFFQQPPCLGPRLLDIRPEAGNLLQFLLGRSQWRSGKANAANRLHHRDLRQRRRPAPAVDRQGQRAAHPYVIERFPFVVRGDQVAAIPVAFLNGTLGGDIVINNSTGAIVSADVTAT